MLKWVTEVTYINDRQRLGLGVCYNVMGLQLGREKKKYYNNLRIRIPFKNRISICKINILFGFRFY